MTSAIEAKMMTMSILVSIFGSFPASTYGILAQYTGTMHAAAVDLRQTCADLRQAAAGSRPEPWMTNGSIDAKPFR
jgi:hypothetical protein